MTIRIRLNGVRQSLTGLGLALALGTQPLHAVQKNWTTDHGDWGTGGNWSPAGVPDIEDDVRIGNLVGVDNSWVTLDQDAFISELTLNDGMTIDTDGHELVVQGTTSISGVNHTAGNVVHYSKIIVRPSGLLAAFDTDILQLSDHGRLRLDGGAIVEIDQSATLGTDTWLEHDGEVRLKGNGGVALRNDGTIDAGNEGLHIKQLGTSRIDLDGTTGDGRVRANILGGDGVQGSRLTITGTELTDAFDGEMTIAGGAEIEMNLDEGWILGINGRIRMFSGGTARLKGAPLSVHGTIQNTGTLSRIHSNTTFYPDARTEITQDDGLELSGVTEIIGGDFSVATGGWMKFLSTTTVRGGNFHQPGDADVNARIEFDGPTSWRGNVNFDTIVSQNNTATVHESSTIHATIFDLDGKNDTSIWNVNHNVSIHTTAIDSGGSNRFDGVMTSDSTSITAGAISIHLPGNDRWQMDGTLHLGGNESIYSTRIAGSPMDVTGTINVNATKVSIAADTRLEAGSTVNVAAIASQLRFAGETYIDKDANLVGLGTMRNVGSMTLENALDTGFVKIENAGQLQLGDGAAQVEVNRFTNFDNGVLNIDLAGLIAGSQFDQLQTDGATLLDGTLHVSFLNGFLPQVGDEFTILQQGVGSIQGAFQNVQGHLAANGVLLLPEYLTQSVKLVAVAHSACDLNLDGSVDASDMGIMFGEWGLGGSADLNQDGVVDAADAGICFADWTGDAMPTLAASTVSVPEPASLTGCVLGFAMLQCRRGRRQSV